MDDRTISFLLLGPRLLEYVQYQVQVHMRSLYGRTVCCRRMEGGSVRQHVEGHARMFKNSKGNGTQAWVADRHSQAYYAHSDPNSRRSMASLARPSSAQGQGSTYQSVHNEEELEERSEEEIIAEDGMTGLRSYAEAGGESDFISVDEFALIEYFADYDSSQMEEDASVTPGRVKDYFEVLGKALNTITDEAVVRYVLQLMNFAIGVVYNSVAEDKRTIVQGGQHNKLLGLLRDGQNRGYLIEASSRLLGHLAICNALSAESFDSLVVWIREAARGTLRDKMHFALQTVMILVREDSVRDALVGSGGVKLLAKLCDPKCDDPQQLYEVCFSLWVMSYSNKASEEFGPNKVIESLCEIISANFREKLTRVAIATLVNVVSKQNGEHCHTMSDCDLLETLKDLSESHWADPDVVAGIDELKEAMQKNYRVLSSFERYRKEVIKGDLKWGPVHSEKFFRENAQEMGEDDFKIVRILIDLLRKAVATSPSIAKASEIDDVEVNLTGLQLSALNDGINMESVAVACYDLGEFMRFYPSGKRVIVTLGAKPLVMSLLEHEDDGVQEQALACCSKIMINNWDQIVGESR